MIRNLLCTVLLVFVSGCAHSSTADNIEAAVKSGDVGAISRAFHDAIYDRFARMDEALPAVRKFLDHRTAFVRLRAAETLYTAGDDSGYSALISLVRSNEPQMAEQRDLRMRAAQVLATYREMRAAEEIKSLYSRTSHGELLLYLAKLRVSASEEDKFPYIAGDLTLEDYVKIDAKKFLPQITATFQTTTKPEIKNAAAYALARMTGENRYIEYLAQAAQAAIDTKPRSGEFSYNDSSKALKYLGSIQSPRAREVLERALDSANGVAIQYAVVNLLFNQPGDSPKARRIVLRQLDGVPLVLDSWESTFQIAAKLNANEIRAAAEAFDKRSGERFWHYWGVERKNWPIYNWIDEYVEDYRGNGG